MAINVRVDKHFTEPSRTKQASKDQCDINLLMKKYKRVQDAEFLRQYNGYVGGQFGDFSHVKDYQSAIHEVRKVNEIFSQLPAVVRKQFANDAAGFLDFVHNPANAAKLVEWGLTKTPTPDALAGVASAPVKTS